MRPMRIAYSNVFYKIKRKGLFCKSKIHSRVAFSFNSNVKKIIVWSIIIMFANDYEEYAADDFACDLGYSNGLLSFFEALIVYEKEAKLNKKMSLVDRLKEKN